MTGPNSHLLLTVVNLQFKNRTNTSVIPASAVDPLLGRGPRARSLESSGPAQVADLLRVTDTTVRAKQVH